MPSLAAAAQNDGTPLIITAVKPACMTRLWIYIYVEYTLGSPIVSIATFLPASSSLTMSQYILLCDIVSFSLSFIMGNGVHIICFFSISGKTACTMLYA